MLLIYGELSGKNTLEFLYADNNTNMSSLKDDLSGFKIKI